MVGRAIQSGRVLIVDDEPLNVMLLEEVLRSAGFTNLRSTQDSSLVLSIFNEFDPDILLLDLFMPGLSGFDVMEQLQAVLPKDTYFPILVLTGNPIKMINHQALALGAKDFLMKPFDLIEVLLRINNLLETRFLHLQMQHQNEILEVKVRERTRDLKRAQIEILQRLSQAAEFRDDATGQHTQRVGRVSGLVAEALGFPDDFVQLIRLAALLHDLGKIGIADEILFKPRGLTPDEFLVMTTHTNIGGRILSGSQSPLLQLAEKIALSHHECWDGSGYPLGLRGSDIPIAGRIVTVADVFDALTHKRCYKEAWTVEGAAAEIDRLSGSKFDPQIVGVFLKLLRDGVLDEDTAAVCFEEDSSKIMPRHKYSWSSAELSP